MGEGGGRASRPSSLLHTPYHHGTPHAMVMMMPTMLVLLEGGDCGRDPLLLHDSEGPSRW